VLLINTLLHSLKPFSSSNNNTASFLFQLIPIKKCGPVSIGKTIYIGASAVSMCEGIDWIWSLFFFLALYFILFWSLLVEPWLWEHGIW
jgi:hypothetical protein